MTTLGSADAHRRRPPVLAALALLVLIALGACSDESGAPVVATGTAAAVPPETRTPMPTATPTSGAPGTMVPSTATPSPTVSATPPPCTDDRYSQPIESPPLPSWTPPTHVADPGLAETIEEALGTSRDSVSVVVIDVTNGRSASVNGSRVWYAASLYKLPVLFEATWQIESGLLEPHQTVTLRCVYAAQDLNTLEALGFQTDDEVSVADAVRYMTIASDNSFAHLMNDLVGPANVDAHMMVLGAASTSVNNAALPTSADDIARILEAVGEGYPSQQSADAMFGLLSEQWVRERIPQGVPAEAVVGNKTGDYPGAAHDAAIVRAPFGTYVLAILTNGQVDNALFVELSSAVYAYLDEQS